jgi:hypothetical protein
VLYNGDTDHVRMIPSAARKLIALSGRTCVRALAARRDVHVQTRLTSGRSPAAQVHPRRR